jgi:hypothetical protein
MFLVNPVDTIRQEHIPENHFLSDKQMPFQTVSPHGSIPRINISSFLFQAVPDTKNEE